MNIIKSVLKSLDEAKKSDVTDCYLLKLDLKTHYLVLCHIAQIHKYVEISTKNLKRIDKFNTKEFIKKSKLINSEIKSLYKRIIALSTNINNPDKLADKLIVPLYEEILIYNFKTEERATRKSIVKDDFLQQTIARLARFYGWTKDEILNLYPDEVEDYLNFEHTLKARETLDHITATSFPHDCDSASRQKTITGLEIAAGLRRKKTLLDLAFAQGIKKKGKNNE